jgi:cyclopropane fatty-acyl-phospholipid synthase-like methyltransferase
MTGGLPIVQYLDRGNYVGVDIRSSVLNLAWREIAKAGLSEKNPVLLHSTSFGSDELSGRRFDFVFSFSVLFHLSDELLRQYLSVVSQSLKPNGRCIANVNVDMQSDRWLEFPFLKRNLAQYEALASTLGFHTRNFGPIAQVGFAGGGPEKNNLLLEFSLAE